MPKKAVTFGELMLRLAPPGYQRFLQSPSFEATFGGGEANVAVSLAAFGLDASFVSRFPANPIGDAAASELRRQGVDVSFIARGGERMGIYYCEKGASQRASKVVYDRAHSAISTATAADFDWKRIFGGADWFHFTGITPALSASCAALCLDACKAAKALGLTVSCDLNYRKNLWSPEKAGEVMATLMPFVDVAIGNEEDADKVFGIKAGGGDVSSGSLELDAYEDVARQLSARFGCTRVAITLRESRSASDNGWGGMLWQTGASGATAAFSRRYDVHIVDRVGSGDAFAAGIIYGMATGMDKQATVEFAAAAACLKHSIEGDFNLVSLAEVKALCAGDGSGRVQR